MFSRRRTGLFALWLLLSALLVVFLLASSQFLLQRSVQQELSQYLTLTLDETYFSTAQDQVNDRGALQRIADQMNESLHQLIQSPWYGVQRNCIVQLARIDGVDVAQTGSAVSLSFGLQRNQIEREIVTGLSCQSNPIALLGIPALLAALFLAIGLILPPPLSKTHRHWINYLTGKGYSGEQGFDLVHGYSEAALNLNAVQLELLEQLHIPGQHNAAAVLAIVTDPRVQVLEKEELAWFLLGIQRDPGNSTAALQLAAAEDGLVIDLSSMHLTLRGLDIPMSATPLLYYTRYAMERMDGDGWLTNPASNRPDLEAGKALADLMSSYGGHAKAINDLEETGLKARTLDQNRSKIKDDIVAIIGEELAASYLFATSKHPDGVRMRYRLQLEPGAVHIIR